MLPYAEGTLQPGAGTNPTTNLAAGHYVLTLVLADTPTVLRSDVDLSEYHVGGVLTFPISISEPVSIEFDIGQ